MWELLEVGAIVLLAITSGGIGFYLGYRVGRWVSKVRPRRNESLDVEGTLTRSDVSDLGRLLGTRNQEQQSFGSAVNALSREQLIAIADRLFSQSVTPQDTKALFAEVRRLQETRK